MFVLKIILVPRFPNLIPFVFRLIPFVRLIPFLRFSKEFVKKNPLFSSFLFYSFIIQRSNMIVKTIGMEVGPL